MGDGSSLRKTASVFGKSRYLCRLRSEHGKSKPAGNVTHFGGKVIFEDGCEVEGESFTPAANQAGSTATTIADLKTDFNALLAKLKAAGLMAADAE